MCKKEHKQAIDCYKKSAEIEPQHEYFIKIADAYLNDLNEYREAIEYYKKASQIDPKLAEIYFGIGKPRFLKFYFYLYIYIP